MTTSSSSAAAPGGGGIPPAQPHWYAPGTQANFKEQLRKILGPAGEWSEHEYVMSGAQLAVRGLAGVFGAMVSGRDFLYTHGVLRPYRATLPVISVGNLTAGGSGKTPFVAMLADWMRRQGRRPAIVARGYGAVKVGRPNDEMMELDLVLNRISSGPPGASSIQPAVGDDATAETKRWTVPTIASPARRYGAVLAEQMGADVVILDDGMQHRQIGRDLDIVLVDARDPLGPGSNQAGASPLEGGAYLPLGYMREGLWALERAGLLVITRTSLATPLWLQRLVDELHLRVPDVPIVLADHKPADLIPHPALRGKKRHLPESLKGRRVGAFCGIANPEGFGKTLRGLGAQLRLSQSFPDHHLYSPAELTELAAYAKRRNCEVLVTTIKDMTKIPDWKPEDVPLYALRVRMDVLEGRAALEQIVQATLSRWDAGQREAKADRSVADEVKP